MKKIEKKEAPPSFNKYKKTKGANYDSLDNAKNRAIKDELREALLKEQGYICCYCGKKIQFDDTIIEHLQSRDEFPKLQLDYQNLLLSCDGGQRARSKNKSDPPYCDSAKGNQEITVTPLQEDCEHRFKCDEEGLILFDAADIEAGKTLEVLNLNNEVLKNQRKSCLMAYTESEWDWEDEVRYLDSLHEGEYAPFCWAIKSYIVEEKINNVEEELIGV